MSKNIDDVLREIAKSNKEIHDIDNHLSKDIVETKRTVKNIENKIKVLESKINQVIELLNNFTIMLMEAGEDVDDLEENEEWSSYESLEDYHDQDSSCDDEDNEEED